MKVGATAIENLIGSPNAQIIDVRAPAEYAADHIPGACNLPVLDDRERAEVGWLYKQVDPLIARRRGAALVAANISALLSGPLADKDAQFRPVIYCWRGGMRSRSLALVLGQIGWPALIIEGGYRRYRRWVREQLATECERFRLIRLVGPTGCGKTSLLAKLADCGAQVIDLEHLACHRGSVLGAGPSDEQPSQKYFESLLAERLTTFDPRWPIWIESESSKIGRLHCPAPFWQRMKTAPMVQVNAPYDARTALLIEQYAHWVAEPHRLKQHLQRLERHIGPAVIARWFALIDQGLWQQFVHAILTEHYDRRYARPRANGASQVLHAMEFPDLHDTTLQDAAKFLFDRFQCP